MTNETDLIRFIFEHLISKDDAISFLATKNIPIPKSFSYEKIANRAMLPENKDKFSLQSLTGFLKNKWEPTDIQYHLDNLKSGHLIGHSWHGASPSTLHLSLQDKVRDMVSKRENLMDLLNIGKDIMKHEYFMVATHDLLETTLIQAFSDTIPPTRSKAIADFIFQGIPYDLKHTNFPKNWDKNNRNKEDLIIALFEGADSDRLRSQAQKSYKGWGLNRLYVVVENQDKWLTEPEIMLKNLVIALKNDPKPIEIAIEGYKIWANLVII